jgi:hypothetical protein
MSVNTTSSSSTSRMLHVAAFDIAVSFNPGCDAI